MTAYTGACLAFNGDCFHRENRGRMKERAMMLAAIHAVTDAHAIWLSACRESHLATKATASDSVHMESRLQKELCGLQFEM
jgi:hypothetical protein